MHQFCEQMGHIHNQDFWRRNGSNQVIKISIIK
jgi:hypothetical protein